ncbi:toprim domain-containing protein [Mumia sp. zg.B21]|uniref:CHC2 zinc finger domain-containing protein n=1 Tax=Mumia sp. zg.B21 TaxID=2855447 RepID=UPI001C6F5ADD|nr:CHC2 zinc finger domain-containing protein [Mumia sp. zg.B21]MBW9210513.1 toprim domain-containing protein [Mumia sp. zg.B21]
MARIPDAELSRLKAEVSVQRLVEGCGVELRQQGKDLVGACPFHDDSSPSLVVTPGKNLWHCLGACRRGGGPIDWVMTAQGVSFRHAVELLREASSALSVLADPKTAGAGPVGRSKRSMLPTLVAPDAADQELLSTVVGYYAETLAGHDEARAFLTRRKIDHPEAVEKFRLGFGDRTLGYRIPGNQTAEGRRIRSRLQKLGVLRATGHEHFRGSLVVPVIDAEGGVGEVYGRKIRDDLRAATPKHLYLPGPHRGVFNIAAFAATDELIVCESLIDALTLWCAGFRHVTAAYGVDGWTPEHQQAVLEHGIKRVLVAFDGDEAGDRGATALAGELGAAEVEVFRVELPRGADVNELAVEAGADGNPTEVLGRYLRKASWMGGTQPSPTPRPAPVIAPGLDSPAHVVEPVEPTPTVVPAAAVAVDQEPLAEEADATGPGQVVGRELIVEFAQRRWRIRGLEKVTSFDVLRVNLLVTITITSDEPSTPSAATGTGFHVDTLDLYSARARSVFVAAAAAELRLAPEVVKADLGRVLLACEAKAEEVIAAAQAPAKPEIRLTSAQREAALELLRDPDLVKRIEGDFGRVGMVGEVTNCLVGYLTAVSRLLPSPLAVIVQSTSAAGKSAVMESVLGFVPDEDRVSFSAMTGQSLFYMGESDLAHKVLSIAEEEGASRAAYALKLLQSEGEISIASTGKDTASGRLVTHTYKVTGPTAIVLTTTAIDIDEELLNRCLVLTVDEDRDQTRAIHAAQRRSQTLAGLAARTERDQIIGVHRDAQRLLEPLSVVNPFADRLTFADGRTRTRRDHGKYLGLISAVTLLHQHQRERKTATVNGRVVSYVETTIGDIEVAHRLAHAVLGQSLDELAPQTRRLLTAVHSYATAEAKKLAIPLDLVRFTRRQLREHLAAQGAGWGDTQLKVHLARLVDLELVYVHRLESGAFGYELTWKPPATPDASNGYDSGQRFLAGLTDPRALIGSDYDPEPVGPNTPVVGPWSGPGRVVVGPQSAPAVSSPPAGGDGAEDVWAPRVVGGERHG